MIHNLKYKKEKGGSTRMMNDVVREFCAHLTNPTFCDGFILLLFASVLWFEWLAPFIAIGWLALFLGARRIVSYFKKINNK